MPCYVGLDCSKKSTCICVIDRDGAVVREGVVPTTPAAITAFLRGRRLRYVRVGFESCGMAAWLYSGLAKAGLPAICIHPNHAHGVLKARTHKTDRNDARGIAELMRVGAFKAVHMKSNESRDAQALLTARRLLMSKIKDLEYGIRGLLLGYGIKLERRGSRTFERRAREACRRNAVARSLIAPLLEVRSEMVARTTDLERRVNALARADPVCQLLTTAPGVGSLTALVFKCCIDEPLRFRSSRALGPHLGLVPRIFQTGEVERRGHISHAGPKELRRCLFMAALSILSAKKKSWLKAWGEQVGSKRGRGRAVIAIARRLAVTLHRMWVTGSPFRWEQSPA